MFELLRDRVRLDDESFGIIDDYAKELVSRFLCEKAGVTKASYEERELNQLLSQIRVAHDIEADLATLCQQLELHSPILGGLVRFRGRAGSTTESLLDQYLPEVSAGLWSELRFLSALHDLVMLGLVGYGLGVGHGGWMAAIKLLSQGILLTKDTVDRAQRDAGDLGARLEARFCVGTTTDAALDDVCQELDQMCPVLGAHVRAGGVMFVETCQHRYPVSDRTWILLCCLHALYSLGVLCLVEHGLRAYGHQSQRS